VGRRSWSSCLGGGRGKIDIGLRGSSRDALGGVGNGLKGFPDMFLAGIGLKLFVLRLERMCLFLFVSP